MPTLISPARVAAATGIIAVLLGLIGCSTTSTTPLGATGASGYPLEIIDCGAPVMIDRAPESIFTVGTAAVELLDAAGASARIVARSGEFDAPLSPDLADPPSDDLIVDSFDPTTEQIIGSGADTVIGYGLFSADVEQVSAAGIQMITVAGECGHDASTDAAPVVDFTTIVGDIRRFGEIFGTEAVADSVADSLEARLAKAKRPMSGDDAAWVYYFSGESGISAYGHLGIPNATLTSAGLENAFADQDATYIDTSMEALLERQPDWIVVGYGFTGDTAEDALARFRSEPGADALGAVASGNLITIPSAVTGAGPTAVTGLETLVYGLGG